MTFIRVSWKTVITKKNMLRSDIMGTFACQNLKNTQV